MYIPYKVHPRSYRPDKLLASLAVSRARIYGGSGDVGGSPSERPLDAVLLHAPFCWEGHCKAEDDAPRGWQGAWYVTVPCALLSLPSLPC